MTETQHVLLLKCLKGWYTAPDNTVYRQCMRAMARGWLTRKDGFGSWTFKITEKGVDAIYDWETYH